MTVTTCVFDAYGTRFDVAAAARQSVADARFPAPTDRRGRVAEFRYLIQLQYSWLCAIANAHADFWEMTEHGLDRALEAPGLAGAG